MDLLPAAIVFVGLILNCTAEEIFLKKETSQDSVEFAFWASLIFAALGILFGN